MTATGVEFLPHFADAPALGVLELSSIARGVQVADAVVKRAPSTLLLSRPVSGGKHIIVLRGPVASVAESMQAGIHAAAEKLIDSLELPMAHEQIWSLLYPGFAGHVRSSRWENPAGDSVAIIETTTVCATLGAADGSAKVAPIVLRDMRLAVGIEGKAFYTLSGDLADVDAAVDRARILAADRIIDIQVIPAPADEIRGRLIF